MDVSAAELIILGFSSSLLVVPQFVQWMILSKSYN